MKFLDELVEIGVRVTGSYAEGTQYESRWAIKGHEPKKGTSDIDFKVPEGRVPQIKEILTKHKFKWKDESEDGLITIETYPQFDFSTKFYPKENKLPNVNIFGTVFETY